MRQALISNEAYKQTPCMHGIMLHEQSVLHE